MLFSGALIMRLIVLLFVSLRSLVPVQPMLLHSIFDACVSQPCHLPIVSK